jgi:hypothetical protein
MEIEDFDDLIDGTQPTRKLDAWITKYISKHNCKQFSPKYTDFAGPNLHEKTYPYKTPRYTTGSSIGLIWSLAEKYFHVPALTGTMQGQFKFFGKITNPVNGENDWLTYESDPYYDEELAIAENLFNVYHDHGLSLEDILNM